MEKKYRGEMGASSSEKRETGRERGERTREILANVTEGQFGDFFRPHDFLDGRMPIPCIHDPGDSDSRLVVVLGDNASGKSFFRRLVGYTVRKGKVTEFGEKVPDGKYPSEMFDVSPEDRMGAGRLGALRYGNEEGESTGDSSLRMVDNTARWIREEIAKSPDKDCAAYFDEPDLGAGLRVAKGVGEIIRKLEEESPPELKSIFVTSHNPALVRQLIKEGKKPHYVFLGDENGPATISEWLEMQESNDVKPVSPEELRAISEQRRSDIQKVMDWRAEERKKGKD